MGNAIASVRPRPYRPATTAGRVPALAAGVDEVSRFRDQIRVRPVEEAHGLELAADRPDAAYHATTKTVNLTPPKQFGGEVLVGYVEDALASSPSAADRP